MLLVVRPASLVSVALPSLLLASCATSPDPAQGGFVSGLNGLLSGGYEQRVQQQSDELAAMQARQAAAEAEASRAQATLAGRQQSVAAMRVSVVRLDRSLGDMQAKLRREHAGNTELSARDAQLARDLDSARARLAALRARLAQGGTPADYDAVRQEYQSLETAIDALSRQLGEE